MVEPLFSVLIANYNNGRYIQAAIESVLFQGYQHFEIIIVDDGSTDDSIKVINNIARIDSRIKVFRNRRNRGVGFTKNKCLQLASGELAGFLDPDDAIVPDALDIMARKHMEHPQASLIYSTNFVCDENLKIKYINEDVGPVPNGFSYLTYSKIKPHRISHLATLKVSRLKGFSLDTSLKKAIDQDQYLKLEEQGDILYIDKPLYYYRHHTANISLNKNAWTAMYYEMRAKNNAFYRRQGKNIPNYTRAELDKEWYEVLKNWALECFRYKTFFKLIKIYCIYLVRVKNIPALARLIYYTIKKHYIPLSFKY
jgi:glycosyltransferase involved in cell wall biosynthesis